MGKTKMQKYIIKRYDDICNIPVLREFCSQSDFLNFGYWDEYTKNQRQACENLMEKLLSFIPTKSGTILDVACGKGATTAYLLKYYPPENVIGINISEKQLETARANAPRCTFLLMDASNLGFPDNSFDNILCVEAAFHFYTREKFLQEAYRVLKQGGRLVLSDILTTLEGERNTESRTEKNYVKNLEEYKAIFHRAGFNELEIVDATEHCWESHFWYIVHYLHQKLLFREINQDELGAYLYHTYRRAFYIEYYPLVSARKI